MKDKTQSPVKFEWFREDFIEGSLPDEDCDPCCPCCGSEDLKFRRSMDSCANKACPIFLGFASWNFVTPFPFTKRAVGIWLDMTSDPAFILPKEVKIARKWAEDVINKDVIEAQKQAIDLGIYEIIRNVTGEGKCEAEWEGCRIVFEQVGTAITSGGKTSITLPDGTTLYSALEKGQKVTEFRHGAWVERIKKHSDEIAAKKQGVAEAEAQQERVAKLKSFSKIDF